MNVYTENGYEDREEYLKGLVEEYAIPLTDIVISDEVPGDDEDLEIDVVKAAGRNYNALISGAGLQPMNAWNYLRHLHNKLPFHSREDPLAKASNSELKRWCQNQAVEINGKRVKWDEMLEFPLKSVVLFPKAKNRTTLW